jgi:protein-tyrosine phosphatase
MAECLLRHKLRERGITGVSVDSAGTGGYHEGNPPHPGTRRALDARGVSYAESFARTLVRSDFDEFDLIIGMDGENMRDIKRIFGIGGDSPKVRKLSEFALTDWGFSDVPDPWHTKDFEETYRLTDDGTEGLIKKGAFVCLNLF